MTALTRQNTLFVSEDWVRIYEALENVDFRAYDFDNLVAALMQYLRNSYPEEFNDWIASSEFVTKIEILAWLSQNISFRMDLNTRENFLATAERRDSLIRLAQNIGYKVNRVRSGSGLLKLRTIRTTQSIVDSNGIDLQNRNIEWDDQRDEDWFERFVLILNEAFAARTQFGSPLNTFTSDGVRTDQFVLNSTMPVSNSYRFAGVINGVNNPFDIYNARLETENGLIQEVEPGANNAFNMFYRVDGRGFGSSNTGFFLPFVQGNLASQDEFFANPEVLRTVTLPAVNVNNSDFFVQQVDEVGNVITNWTQVDTIFGESTSFNTLAGTLQNVYEVDTLTNDRVRVRFGDGTFGRIPTGRFRFWYRTANPSPSQIRPSAIQNQLVSIPYVKNGQFFTLTMTFSLEETVSNAAPTESNFDIRTRAGKVFYTQNRMVTGQDYNNFFLRDNSIQKVKSVNRTFAGQSRYARLNDPLSLYQNVRHIAEDGRLYQDETVTINQFTADTAILTVDALLNQEIKPLIRKEDKRILYFNKYAEIIFSNAYSWSETSQIAGSSRGNVLFSGVAQTVGDTGSGNLQYINTDAVVRFGGPKGAAVSVDRVIEGGTAADGVILRDVVADGTSLFSVFPALRNNFTQAEETEILTRLEQRLDFAISWNQATETWQFINADNIDKTGDFGLINQGDATGAALDASWMILLEFLPNDPSDLWRITDRGESLFFESAREIDFVFSNTEAAVDPETGRAVRDAIIVSQTNESRDSLRRRGLEDLGDAVCEVTATIFIGDGGTTKFQTQEVPLLAETTVIRVGGVFQIFGVDFTIEPNTAGYFICFVTPPGNGVEIEVRTSSRFRNATQSVVTFTGNGTTEEYDLFAPRVQAANTISFLDGVLQNSSLDFGIGVAGSGNDSIVYNEVIPTGVVGAVYVMSGIDNAALTKSNFTANGTQTAFTIPTFNQTSDTVLVALDGVVQAPSSYTVAGAATDSTITFNTAPGADTRVRVISVADINRTRANQYEFAASGSNNTFTLANNASIPTDGDGVIVFLDGVQQDGPWATTPGWTVTGSNAILFATNPPADTVVTVFVIAGSVGVICDTDPDANLSVDNNRGLLDVESCLVSFLGQEVEFTPTDVIRHPDGYVNKNGLQISPVDGDQDGTFDAPFIFKDLVLQNGFTDLVLWRRVQEFGFSVFDPISSLTSPKGTYGNSAAGDVALNDTFDPDADTVNAGDIHLDTNTKEWLIADGTTNTWILAPDQTAFRSRIGRDNLRFTWVHYAPEANRIDPSKSNIMNVYILTGGFDQAYRTWLSQNGAAADEPQPETSEQLRIQYQDFEEFKPISDSIIYYPSRYKPLFGDQAVTELQATFKIIQTPGSNVSESDLKLRVLSAIDEYFNVDRWDFGDQFFFTEMVAFVHAQLAPDLQSMVVVPRNNDQAFGRLFQVRAEPDELFISAASPDDVEVVRFFTDTDLRIGTLV